MTVTKALAVLGFSTVEIKVTLSKVLKQAVGSSSLRGNSSYKEVSVTAVPHPHSVCGVLWLPFYTWAIWSSGAMDRPWLTFRTLHRHAQWPRYVYTCTSMHSQAHLPWTTYSHAVCITCNNEIKSFSVHVCVTCACTYVCVLLYWRL